MEAVGEEPTFIQSVLPEHLENVDFTFFAADEAFTRNTWQMARNAGSDIIDLSYALEDRTDVQSARALGGARTGHDACHRLRRCAGAWLRIPQPMVLALLLLRAQKVAPIARAIATLFEPASEHGRRGMDELHEQTVNLLSFQQLPEAFSMRR